MAAAPGAPNLAGGVQLPGLEWLGVRGTSVLILVSSFEAYIYMPRCNEAAAAWRFFAGVMAVHAAVTAAVWYRASVCRRTGRMPAVLMLLLLLLQLGCGASTVRKLGLQQACSMPSFWPTILQITLPEVVTFLAYIITVTTGVWQVPPGGQGPWWRPLLPSVVHAATWAAAAIRVTAAWPVIAFFATMGLILGSDAWTMAWPTVRERLPGSIATWGDQHVANGLLADVHAGFDAVDHLEILQAVFGIYLLMAGFNVAALFAVELPAWLSAMLQGQGMQPAERAAAPA